MGKPFGEPKTSPRRVATALRRGKALQMRLAGANYEAIAKELGYSSRASAVTDIRRALVATVQEPADEVRALELARLDMMWNTVLKVLARNHVTVSNGKIIYLGGVPVKDDSPVLQAVDRLLKIQERRAKYLGLDAPKAFEVVTLDAVDAQIRALTEELERVAAADESVGEEDAEEPDGAEAVEASGTAAATG